MLASDTPRNTNSYSRRTHLTSRDHKPWKQQLDRYYLCLQIQEPRKTRSNNQSLKTPIIIRLNLRVSSSFLDGSLELEHASFAF